MRLQRAAAACVVVAVAVASAAYAGLGVVDNPALSRAIPASQTGAIVFSVRNTGATMLQIGSAAQHVGSAAPGCAAMAIAPVATTPPYQLAPGAQAQYTITTATGFATAGTWSCFYDLPVTDLSNGSNTVTTVDGTFDVAGSGSAAVQVDLQARRVDYGPATTTFEDQIVMLSDYGTATSGQPYTLAIVPPDPSGSLHFVGACTGATCIVTTPSNNGGRATATLECEAAGTTAITASLEVTGSGGGSSLATSTVTCNPAGKGSSAIEILEQPSITLTGPAGVPTAAGSAHVMNLGSANAITSIAISGGNFAFAAPTPCTGAGPCALAPPLPLPPEQALYVTCTPISGMPQAATLTVVGLDAQNDIATTTLDCIAGSNGPLMTVSPNMIGPVETPVNQPTTAATTVTIGNAGDQDLTGVVVSVSSPQWMAGNCVTVPCTVTPGGTQTVTATFDPTAWGGQTATMTITAGNDPTHPGSVVLSGVGDGAILNPPSPTSFNFGTIPRGESFSHSFSVSETGNVGTTLTMSDTMSAFQTSPPSLALAAGGTGQLSIACASPTSGTFSDTVSVIADGNVYTGSPQTIGVTCVVADTDVQVMPTTLDFGEVRVGTAPAPTISVTITNTGPVPAVLHRVALSDGHGGQLEVAPGITSDVALPANGGAQQVVLTLETTAELDLAGTQLLIDVDSAHLSPAISGKVVSAKSHVTPAMLDLGTACVGTQVSAIEMLVNDGTATLVVSQPMMDQGFAVLAQTPANYPATLAPGATASVQIKPAASAIGMVTGTLTWHDSVPSDYTVPVSLNYVASGTALSPAQLDFGQLAIDVRSAQQMVTLQNCDSAAATVTIEGVFSLDGTARAWDVEPGSGTHVLAPGERLTLAVAFAPLEAGPYHAQIRLALAGQPGSVDLYGDATGPAVSPTSFYACTCTSGTPAGGWPIAIALAAITVRRRRGSS